MSSGRGRSPCDTGPRESRLDVSCLALAGDQGLGAVAIAAFDEPGGTGLFFAPQNRSLAAAISR